MKAATELNIVVAAPSEAWLQAHRWPLVAALIPSCISEVMDLVPAARGQFCQ